LIFSFVYDAGDVSWFIQPLIKIYITPAVNVHIVQRLENACMNQDIVSVEDIIKSTEDNTDTEDKHDQGLLS